MFHKNYFYLMVHHYWVSYAKSYDTIISGKSIKGEKLRSTTPSKIYEQNIVVALNDIFNVRHVVKEKRKFAESRNKLAKTNTVKY